MKIIITLHSSPQWLWIVIHLCCFCNAYGGFKWKFKGNFTSSLRSNEHFYALNNKIRTYNYNLFYLEWKISNNKLFSRILFSFIQFLRCETNVKFSVLLIDWLLAKYWNGSVFFPFCQFFLLLLFIAGFSIGNWLYFIHEMTHVLEYYDWMLHSLTFNRFECQIQILHKLRCTKRTNGRTNEPTNECNTTQILNLSTASVERQHQYNYTHCTLDKCYYFTLAPVLTHVQCISVAVQR